MDTLSLILLGVVMEGHILDRLTRQYYSRINHHFCCRLDCRVEAERLARETLRNAVTLTQHTPADRIEMLLLSIAADLLRQRWLLGQGERLAACRGFTPCPTSGELYDQAAALYMQLCIRPENHAATAEASLAIHRWIGADPHRQDAYNWVRKVLYRKDESRPAGANVLGPNIRRRRLSSNTGDPEFNTDRLDWSDIVLLLFVFLLLLPMIYFMALPGS